MAARKTEAPEGPQPVQIHYVGAGDYVIGYSTDPAVTTVVDPSKAADLVGTGLFAEGPAPAAPTSQE